MRAAALKSPTLPFTLIASGGDLWLFPVFLSATRWTGEPYLRSECDDLRWCPLDILPENTIPFVRRAIERHLQAGIWFDEVYFDVDWPPAHPLEKGDCDADCDR